MITDIKSVKAGVQLIDPIGRKHHIKDVFVPKNNREKQALVPSSFRNWSRKVIVFTGGSVMPLSDARRRYKLAC